MTDTPEERLAAQALRPDARSITQFAPFVMLDHAEAAIAAARVDEAAKERARIVKWLRDEAEMPSEEGPALWLASFNGYDGTNSRADARVLLNAAADLIERGSGVPEGGAA